MVSCQKGPSSHAYAWQIGPFWRDTLDLSLPWYMLLPWHHMSVMVSQHDDVIKWKHFPRYWPFVRGIHRSPVNSPHKGQWRGALMFSLICAWINGWVNNREAGDLTLHRCPLWHHRNEITNNSTVQLLVQGNIKENIKGLHYWPLIFVRGIQQ